MALPRSQGNTADPIPAGRRRRRRRSEATEETVRAPVRRDEERRRQRLAITIGAMLVVVIFTIVAVGYYLEFYQPPRVLAGQIRDVKLLDERPG